MRFLFWAAMAATFAFAAVPFAIGGQGGPVYHVLAFVTLGLLAGRTFRKSHPMKLLCALIAFGAIIEVTQAAMPYGRTGDPLDLLADIVAASLGIFLSRTLPDYSRSRTQVQQSE